MEFVLVQNGLAAGVIVATQAHADKIAHKYEAIIDVSTLARVPNPGIPYVNGVFEFPPPDPPLPPSQRQLLKEKLKTDKANGKTDNPNPVAMKELLDDVIDLLEVL